MQLAAVDEYGNLSGAGPRAFAPALLSCERVRPAIGAEPGRAEPAGDVERPVLSRQLSGGLRAEVVRVEWGDEDDAAIGDAAGPGGAAGAGAGAGTARLWVRLCGKAGPARLILSDAAPRSGLLPTEVSIAVTAGPPRSLALKSFVTRAVLGEAFGPLHVDLLDGWGNPIPLGAGVILDVDASAAIKPAGAHANAPAAVAAGAVADGAADGACDGAYEVEVLEREFRPWGGGGKGSASLHLAVRRGALGPVRLRVGARPSAACDAAPTPAEVGIVLTTGRSFYSENAIIAKALEARNWTSARTVADASHLAWTVRAADVDLGRQPRGKLCNHFEHLEITTKVGIAECLQRGARANASADSSADGADSPGSLDARGYFPRCYDLADPAQLSAFSADFDVSAA